MANTECTIVVLDVRKDANADFKEQSKRHAAEIIRHMICSGKKKNYISLVLLGTERAQNEAALPNIHAYEHVQLATWNLLMSYYQLLSTTPTATNGDWFSALEVAVAMQEQARSLFRVRRQRIICCCDFALQPADMSNYDQLANELTAECIELLLCAPNIESSADGQAKLLPVTASDKEQQKYLQRLVCDCSAVLTSAAELPNIALINRSSAPWTWSATLRIGQRITIEISGVIAMKDEPRVKLERRWCAEDEELSREVRYFIKGTEVTLEPQDYVDGYMLGGTPVPYDKSVAQERQPLPTGLMFIGFVKRDAVPSEYFCGDSLYTIVHRRGRQLAARRLDALVRALDELKLRMLCWKVYSAKLNHPKLVLLLPQPGQDERPSMFGMVELAYSAQQLHWDFPALRTSKTECSDADYAAIDALIDGMDLSGEKELLRFDRLPHVYEQQLMDMLERKVLRCASDKQDASQQAQLQALEAKSLADSYWAVPAPIEQSAKRAANAVRQRFRLQYSSASMAKAKTRCGGANDESRPAPACVRRESARADFERLVKREVAPMSDGTQRLNKLLRYAKQLELVLDQWLGESPLPVEQLTKAMAAYRRRCWRLNAEPVYNEWIGRMRALAVQHGWKQFWRDIVVKHKLGVLLAGDVADKQVLREFYEIEGWQSATQPLLTADLLDDIDGAAAAEESEASANEDEESQF